MRMHKRTLYPTLKENGKAAGTCAMCENLFVSPSSGAYDVGYTWRYT